MRLALVKRSMTKDNVGRNLKSVALSKSIGGFTLSKEAEDRIIKLSPVITPQNIFNILRDDQILIDTIKVLGCRANGKIYGLEMPIIVITFEFDPETEHYAIFNFKGYEDLMIVNKLTKDRFWVTADGKRQEV